METLFEKTLVMILCGGKGERLYPLTRDRAKPSVPFLGSYRIIDFSLSNALNSGLRKIALLTQYKSLSLERHIFNGWNIFPAESRGFIISLPAQGRVGDRWYEGTADAVFQNIYTIQAENPTAVLVLSGDHIYKADYRKVIRFFHEKDADAVILAKPIDRRRISRFGVVAVDQEKKILAFVEKPKQAPAALWSPDQVLISMGVYLFRTPVLIRALIQDAKNSQSSHDFGKDVLPRLIKKNRIYAYLFEDYWEDIGTIDAYWKANMSFLSSSPPFHLQDQSWPIRTYSGQYPPSYIEQSQIQNSILSAGCSICGATIKNSIISLGVKISNSVQVEDSIVFAGVEIGKGAKLRKVIIDKFSRIPSGFAIGYDDGADRKNFKFSEEGIRIVPKGWSLE